MRRVWRSGCLCGLALALVACGAPKQDPAVRTYERFVSALHRGDAPTVWALLSPQSRESLRGALGLGESASEAQVLDRLAVRADATLEIIFPRQARVDPDQAGAARRVVVAPMGDKELRFTVIEIDGEWRMDLFADGGSPSGGA